MPAKKVETATEKGTSMDEDEVNDKEVSAAKKATTDAEKQRLSDAAIQKEAAENVLWPDGLIHKGDGTKIYKPDGQVVSGVNSYSQKHAEPPAAPAAKEDGNVETMTEGAER